MIKKYLEKQLKEQGVDLKAYKQLHYFDELPEVKQVALMAGYLWVLENQDEEE
jgi:hypothetical protein